MDPWAADFGRSESTSWPSIFPNYLVFRVPRRQPSSAAFGPRRTRAREEVRDTWVNSIIKLIQKNFENVGKGWFSIRETNPDTYAEGKVLPVACKLAS